MTRARVLAVVLVVACGLVNAATSEASELLHSKPAVFPAFQSGTPDYVVRCKSGKPVRLTFSAPQGTTVSVAGAAPRSGRFTTKVDLEPGHALRFDISRAGRTRTYHARCLPHDFPKWSATRNGTPQARFYILTPNDNRVIPRYVAIFDSYGVPLWWMRRPKAPFNASLLPNGNLVWTRLGIHDPISDFYEERALDGQLVRTYNTVGTTVNEHEFQMLPNGNVLMTDYPPRDGVDLSRWGGPRNATVLDGEIQEVDPQGKLVWSWSTKGHVRTGETGRWFHELTQKGRPIPLKDGRHAYDLVHLNSIAPVGDDRVVFSARHLDAVYEVDRASEKIVWKLGGKHTSRSLRILGDPYASTDFGGQHDARVFNGGRLLTVYDNSAHRDRPPRVLEFRIDEKARTAKLVKDLRFAPARDSICCGGARLLPGGNWVVAWGHTPYVTEQTPSGRPVLTIEFAKRLMMSYRAEPILPGRLLRSTLRRGMDAMAAP